MPRVYVNDIGTEIRVHCVSDISAAVTPAIAVRKPDGSEASWAATRDGEALVYFTLAGDLSLPGTYRLQAVPNLPSWSGRGETALLKVFANFE
jgi:hypothetical protein